MKKNQSKISSFKRLSEYIQDKKNQGQKVDHLFTVNCKSSDMANTEITAVQNMNQRTQKDKTYHLIVSFREGETLSLDQLKDIEASICEGIGFKEHQRVVATHSDTRNYHMHMAINKIHPQTFNIKEPYHAHYTFSALCLDLEKKHGLEPDNHHPHSRGQDNNTHQIDCFSGMISFTSWIQEKVKEPLLDHISQPSPSWESVNKLLADYHLELRKRGNGLVFSHKSQPLFVKASSISRTFSKKSLESILGHFKESELEGVNPKERYRKEPFYSTESRKLYQEFACQKQDYILKRRTAFTSLRDNVKQQRQTLKEQFKQKRFQIKTDLSMNKRSKKALYSLLKMEQVTEHQHISESAKEKRFDILLQYSLNSWQDFLIQQVDQGNTVAHTILKYRKAPQSPSKRANTISSHRKVVDVVYKNYNYHIHRNGDITYTLSSGACFRDEGKQVRVSSISRHNIEAALQFSIHKYGPVLTLNGTDDFKKQVQVIAKEKKLNTQFLGLDLEPKTPDKAPLPTKPSKNELER
ncbi:MAG: relaxase/mobilization nuclease domain-containing protein [Candidatus Margulisbacteria bacterium]|nr:relaxase/mobilization nuclease domain-containing protein [Candidatus Margulisiibacteriota bacterium]